MAVGGTKNCTCCGSKFNRRMRDSQAQWESRAFCSILCANRSKKEKTPVEQRFWRHVGKRAERFCWEWIGSHDDRGYGTISAEAGISPVRAHRLSWEMHFGAIPDGLNVCHACDNPGCVNPMHLLLGTQAANALDMARKGRINPISLLNLQPGQVGHYGAAPKFNKELEHG